MTESDIRKSERERCLRAVVSFLDDGGGSFRKFLPHIGMAYVEAYSEGWMGFTNALSEYADRVIADAEGGSACLNTLNIP